MNALNNESSDDEKSPLWTPRKPKNDHIFEMKLWLHDAIVRLVYPTGSPLMKAALKIVRPGNMRVDLLEDYPDFEKASPPNDAWMDSYREEPRYGKPTFEIRASYGIPSATQRSDRAVMTETLRIDPSTVQEALAQLPEDLRLTAADLLVSQHIILNEYLAETINDGINGLDETADMLELSDDIEREDTLLKLDALQELRTAIITGDIWKTPDIPLFDETDLVDTILPPREFPNAKPPRKKRK